VHFPRGAGRKNLFLLIKLSGTQLHRFNARGGSRNRKQPVNLALDAGTVTER